MVITRVATALLPTLVTPCLWLVEGVEGDAALGDIQAPAAVARARASPPGSAVDGDHLGIFSGEP